MVIPTNKTKNMKTISKLHEVVTSCGNAFRGVVEVAGKEFILEASLDKKHLQIIDENSSCETCLIDEVGDVIFNGGEYVTGEWTPADWSELTEFVGVK